MIDELFAYINEDESRIDQELNEYKEVLIASFDQELDSEQEELKKLITMYTDVTIQSAKDELADELNSLLYDYYLEEVDSNQPESATHEETIP